MWWGEDSGQNKIESVGLEFADAGTKAKVDLKLAHTQNINPDLPTSSLVPS